MRPIDADALIENLQGSKVTTDSKDMDYKTMWQLLCTLVVETIENEPTVLPSADAVHRWSNHEVACMLAELFGDTCACDYNSIDEWLPLVCDFKDICPNTVGVACWEQFMKHYKEHKGGDTE